MKLLTLALLVVGCGMQVDGGKMVAPPEHADEAISAIAAAYGMPIPTVYWYGKKLACVDHVNRPWCGDGGICWLSDNGAGCTAGENQDGVALVSNFGGNRPISTMMVGDGQTVLAHELAHIKWGDPNHQGPWFAVGGAVDQQTAMLLSNGW